jgi:hypothetical protein
VNIAVSVGFQLGDITGLRQKIRIINDSLHRPVPELPHR